MATRAAGEDDVRLAPEPVERSPVDAVSQTARVELAAQLELGRGVPLPLALHPGEPRGEEAFGSLDPHGDRESAPQRVRPRRR